jgi:hypothetical protein
MSPKNPVRVPSDEELVRGHDIRSLGPSDSSDTGADMMGIEGLDSTSDRQGTGERQSIETGLPGEDLDLRPNRVVSARDAGLGGGLDQAEEAQFGVTDEELEKEFAPDDEE